MTEGLINISDKSLFDFLRKKKAEWTGKPKAKLTQEEVDEFNGVIHPELEPIVVTAPKVPAPDEKMTSKIGPLAAIIGPVAATLALTMVPQEEGLEYKAYRDIAGIWTICSGDTNDVHAGLIETSEGCRQRTERQLVIHARGMMLCTPNLAQPGKDYIRAAGTSFTYNVGVGAYCHSSADRNFDASKWLDGCNAFRLWNKAKVEGRLRVVRGLDNRRQREIQVCGTNLVPGWTPQNLKQRVEAIK